MWQAHDHPDSNPVRSDVDIRLIGVADTDVFTTRVRGVYCGKQRVFTRVRILMQTYPRLNPD